MSSQAPNPFNNIFQALDNLPKRPVKSNDPKLMVIEAGPGPDLLRLNPQTVICRHCSEVIQERYVTNHPGSGACLNLPGKHKL